VRFLEVQQSSLPLTVMHGIRAAMLRTPEKIALRHKETKRTYQDLVRRIDQVANACLSSGILRPSQHAVVVSKNRVEYAEVVCGLGEAGVVAVTITPRITAAELEAICDDAGARVLFADAESALIARQAALRTVERIITFGDEYESWLAQNATPSSRPAIDERSAWVMGYTSGTTGKPKGALLSHRSRVLMILAAAAEFGCYSADDSYLAVTPFNHGGALLRLMASLYFGGYVEIVDKFEAEPFMRLLSAGRFTSTAVVPSHFHAIFSLPDDVLEECRTPDLRAILSHGAPLSQSMKERTVSHFGPNVLYETYGSTEAGVVTVIKPKDQLRKKDSVGTPFPGTEIKIVDENGEPSRIGEVGELFSRSPYLFNGYWNKPLETKGAFHHGWVTVGDLARRDEEGYFYIVGRRKDMIISGGVNIYPKEVEDVLLLHPDISEAAVIGVPDDKWGQRLRATIVAREGTALTGDDVISFCRGKIASYKIPKDIEFRRELPRNATGKVLKAVLQTSDAS
jgi:acyl-CoA synthetase (AMP-forming)/AMP-acid ligase II